MTQLQSFKKVGTNKRL